MLPYQPHKQSHYGRTIVHAIGLVRGVVVVAVLALLCTALWPLPSATVHAEVVVDQNGELTDAPTWTKSNPPTIKIGDAEFTKNSNNSKEYTYSELYYPNGRGSGERNCTSVITFDKPPTKDNGGQEAELVVQHVSAGQGDCEDIGRYALVIDNASRINGNKADTTKTPGSTLLSKGTFSPGNNSQAGKPICDPKDPACQDAALNCGKSGSGDCGVITKYINPFVRFLSGFAALASVIGVLYGSIRYITSSGDANAAAKAKGTIRNAIVAFVCFLFLWVFLTWLVPPGWLAV